jgi:hypothetical protein
MGVPTKFVATLIIYIHDHFSVVHYLSLDTNFTQLPCKLNKKKVLSTKIPYLLKFLTHKMPRPYIKWK